MTFPVSLTFSIIITSHYYQKLSVTGDLFQLNEIIVFDPMLQTVCFLWTWYWQAQLQPSSAKVAIDWWWRVSPCLHLAERRTVLLLLHICTQAQGPANSVSFPSNKRSFERRWCVLLCVTVLPGEVFFFFFFALSCCSTSSSLNVLFPSFALWVFQRLAGV